MYKSLPFPAHPFFKASMFLFFLVFGLEGTWPTKNGGIYANFGRQHWFFQLFLRITEPQNWFVITCTVRQMLPNHKDFCWFESTTPSYKTINWCTEPDFVVYLTYSGVFFNQLSLQKIHEITMIKPKINHQYTFLPRQFSSSLLFSNQYARGSNKSVDPWINCVEAHSHGGIDYKGPLGCLSWKNMWYQ